MLDNALIEERIINERKYRVSVLPPTIHHPHIMIRVELVDQTPPATVNFLPEYPFETPDDMVTRGWEIAENHAISKNGKRRHVVEKPFRAMNVRTALLQPIQRGWTIFIFDQLNPDGLLRFEMDGVEYIVPHKNIMGSTTSDPLGTIAQQIASEKC